MAEQGMVALVSGASRGIGEATARRLALYLEERPHRVHVGMVLPGFVATEGFPATELRERALTRWLVSKPEKVAEAIGMALPCGIRAVTAPLGPEPPQGHAP